ncbi:MAG TPA: GNAT family N-acetyltransferase [Candidatus Limnocylindrales bacterium]
MVDLDLAGAPAIPGLRFRRPRGDDADYAAMAAVVVAANAHDEVPYLPSAANVREELSGSDTLDERADVVLAEIDGHVIAEAGVERVVRAGIAVYQTWGHVVPEARRRGIGRAMLTENIRRARERAAGEPDGQPWDIRGHAEEGETGHVALLTDAGFQPIRFYFAMRRPTLDGIPEVALPDGLEIRPITPDQHRAIWEAEGEAFRDHWQAREPTDADFEVLFGREELDTDLWIVAWDRDEIAGVVQTWIWGEENERLGVRRGWLEHISVRRPWRRRGLGRAITAAALRRLRDVGMTEAMLGVDAEHPTGALGLYEGLGFEVYQRSAMYRLDPTDGS